MSENEIIQNTKFPNTVQSIMQDLLALGIKQGDTLLVHSSLSSLGWVCGGAQAVIEALIKSVGDNGTIVMPSHSGDWSDPAIWSHPPVPVDWIEIIYETMPAFEPLLTPTRGMGRIAELFRTIPGTVRSNHPQVSFSAHGKLAKDITCEHDLTPQFGMNSPLGQLVKHKAKVLLLGVDYDSCTSFHLSEVMTGKMNENKMGTAIKENGVRVWKWFEDFDYDNEDFKEIGKAIEAETEIVKTGMVGQATCKLFRLDNGVDFATNWLLKNRFNNN